MNENKQAFLDSLSNTSLPVNESEKLLALIDTQEFFMGEGVIDIIDPEAKHWDQEDFFKVTGKIKRDEAFTRENCEYILKIKTYLQSNCIKGFSLLKGDQVTHKGSKSFENLSEEELFEHFKSMEFSKKFKVHPNFSVAITENDLATIKSLLMLYISDKNYSVEDALLSLKYCYEHRPEIFEEYAVSKLREPINEDIQAWTREYLMEQQIFLNVNFSLKRLLHMINVASYLGNKTTVSRLIEPEKIQGKPNSQESGRQDKLKKAMMLGGAVVAAILILLSISR